MGVEPPTEMYIQVMKKTQEILSALKVWKTWFQVWMTFWQVLWHLQICSPFVSIVSHFWALNSEHPITDDSDDQSKLQSVLSMVRNMCRWLEVDIRANPKNKSQHESNAAVLCFDVQGTLARHR